MYSFHFDLTYRYLKLEYCYWWNFNIFSHNLIFHNNCIMCTSTNENVKIDYSFKVYKKYFKNFMEPKHYFQKKSQVTLFLDNLWITTTCLQHTYFKDNIKHGALKSKLVESRLKLTNDSLKHFISSVQVKGSYFKSII